MAATPRESTRYMSTAPYIPHNKPAPVGHARLASAAEVGVLYPL